MDETNAFVALFRPWYSPRSGYAALWELLEKQGMCIEVTETAWLIHSDLPADELLDLVKRRIDHLDFFVLISIADFIGGLGGEAGPGADLKRKIVEFRKHLGTPAS